MRVDLFNYELPPERIATQPMEPREAARLLCVGEALADRRLRDLPSLVRPGDVWVLNNTRVIPAQLFGMRGEVKIGVTLHKALDERRWLAFAKPGKKLKPGDVIRFAENFAAELEEKHEDGQVTLRFLASDAPPSDWLLNQLQRYGAMPLPPYMRRAGTAQDKADYQTVFAQHDGSVAAPTAGLHFTPALLAAMRAAGAEFFEVTLHVGGGTFLPVKVEDTDAHVMHSEWCEIVPSAAEAINIARAEGRRVVAVGTTSLRTLESMAAGGKVQAGSKETALFITPGYEFQIVDALLTNFHLPRSTLLMLVSAFCGRERMLAAYAHAIAQEYRFFSYGDACFLERDGLL